MSDRLDKAIRAAAADIVEAAPPPPPDPVAAARQRHRIPFWVLPALVLLPVLGFMYARALASDVASEDGRPLSAGAALYSNCAFCHGGSGDGVAGQGYQFSEGEVLATFPRIEDQIRFVHYGTDRYRQAGVEVYGDPNRSNGPHITGQRGIMPPFGGELTTAEIVAVVCHERYTVGGADPTSDTYADEYDAWCSPDAVVFAMLESGELDLIGDESARMTIEGTDLVIAPIGPSPIAGSGQEE